LPARITVDENGYVVAVKSLPALKSRLEPSGTKRASKAKTVASAKKSKRKHGIKASKSGKSLPRTTHLEAGSKSWILCPTCGVSLLEKNLRKHQRKTHAIYAASSSSVPKAKVGTPTPKKNKKPENAPSDTPTAWRRKIRLLKEKARRLDQEIKNLQEVRSSENAARARVLRNERDETLEWVRFCVKRLQGSAPIRESKNKTRKKTKKKSTRLLSPSAGGKRDKTGKGIGLSGQALHQSFEDPSYAGRGLGHMRREQGRFGSLPLYDDYGEESGAD